MPSVDIVLHYVHFRILLRTYHGQVLLVFADVEQLDQIDLYLLLPTSIFADNIHAFLQSVEFREDYSRQSIIREAGSHICHHQRSLQLSLCLLPALRECLLKLLARTDFNLVDSNLLLIVGFWAIWNAETRTKQYTIQNLNDRDLLLVEFKFDLHANQSS